MKTWMIGMAVGSLLAFTAMADSLELKNGDILNGSYMGGTANSVRFQANAELKVISVKDILALTFTRAGGNTLAAPGVAVAAPIATPAAVVVAAPTVTVSAGTTLTIRMVDSVDSTRHATGHKFTAKLESDFRSGNTVVAPRGSNVYGVLAQAKQSRRAFGKSELTLELTGILIDGKIHPMVTRDYSSKSKSTGRKTARRALLGAAIGAAVDGSSGAKAGAGIGAGSSLLTKGERVSIPANTLLDFRLQSPFQK